LKVTLKLARIGMSMQVATIAEWLIPAGTGFSQGDPLYAIETDKVTQEVLATGRGRMLEVLVEAGDEVAVGAAVCVIDIDL
jgi:pyruvate/2-oxoglutarate dehydrogenase complex dihydrolipoamide acyltransferase (E2) component